MEAMLTKLLHISLSAGLIVMGLALLRPLLHKKMSKWVCCLLWGLVAVRLLIPFNVEATVYLPMKAEPPVQEMATGEADQEHLGGTADTPILGGVQTNPNFPIENPNVQNPNTQNPDIQIPDTQSPVITPGAQAPSTQNPDSQPQPPMIPTPVLPKIEPWQIAMTVWIGGMVLMLVYSVISILRVHLRVREGVKMEDRIYLCDRISAAFLYGVINPKICLPESLSMRDREYVIAHEQAHLARRDNLWRALGFLLLTIHWFNPLLWLGYALYCRDIELACDERVIRSHGETYRAPYARALLNCTVRQKPNAITAVEFGKQDIKERIVSIMKKRRISKVTTILLCLLMCLLTFVSCLEISGMDANIEPDLEETEKNSDTESTIIETETEPEKPLPSVIETKVIYCDWWYVQAVKGDPYATTTTLEAIETTKAQAEYRVIETYWDGKLAYAEMRERNTNVLVRKFEYDDEGRVAVVHWYVDNGTPYGRYVREYNEEGLLVKELRYVPDFDVLQTTFDYDENGRLIHSKEEAIKNSGGEKSKAYEDVTITYDADGNPIRVLYLNGEKFKWEYQYEYTNGLLTKRTTFLTEGKPYCYSLYEYENGYMKTETEYLQSGEFMEKIVYDKFGNKISYMDDKTQCEDIYDEKGRLISHSELSQYGYHTVINYEYDEKDNISKKSIQVNDIHLFHVEYSFDENDVCIKSKFYNAAGEMKFENDGYSHLERGAILDSIEKAVISATNYNQNGDEISNIYFKNGIAYSYSEYKKNNGDYVTYWNRRYDESGVLTSESIIDETGKQTEKKYYAEYTQVTETYGNVGETTHTIYTKDGKMAYSIKATKVNRFSNYQVKVYNAKQELILEVENAKFSIGVNLTVVDYKNDPTVGTTISFQYDENGLMLSVSN